MEIPVKMFSMELPMDDELDLAGVAGLHRLEIRELVSLPEKQLQSTVIEPLLQRMGFKNVRDTSGSRERGKDLVATREDLGREYLWSIQIKRFRPSSRAGSETSFGRLLDQLKQAIQEPVVDPTTNCRRSAQRCLFITPYPISPNVAEHFFERLHDPIFNILRIIDGRELADLINRYCPELLGRFSLELQYRAAMANTTGRISESGVAFELTRTLELDNIYVDISLGEGSDLMRQLSAAPAPTGDRLIVTISPIEAQQFSKEYERWVGTPLIDPAQLPRGKDVNVDVASITKGVKRRLHSGLSVDHSRTIIDTSIRLERELRHLRRHPFIVRYLPELAFANPTAGTIPGMATVPSSALMNVYSHLYVLGAPGTGKTTLLRRLAQLSARDTDAPLPVFLPLIKLDEYTYDGLLRAIRVAVADQVSGSAERSTAENGDTQPTLRGRPVRLCLDGLDEVGPGAAALFQAIDLLATRNSGFQIILSCRDTFFKIRTDDLFSYWDAALSIRLLPFTPEQLQQFVTQWFSAEPSTQSAMMQWLEQNPDMQLSATTPLLAALLCSLFQLGADMPNTELDLYQRRFELLLGRWDRAKGIPSLPPDLRNRYRYFLMHLAYTMHQKETRSYNQGDALELATQYYDVRFHASAFEMLRDCIRRGLLELNERGQVSFGHLTYQEYMCGEWLAYQNKVNEIAGYLADPWWGKACDFYAARKQDVGALIRALLLKPVPASAGAKMRKLIDTWIMRRG